jgi:hypothetical protein
MSNRERAFALLDEVPDFKIDCVIAYIQGIIAGAGTEEPNGADIIKDYVTELSRLQNWMLLVKGKAPEAYEAMHDRYVELKVTLTSLGVNITELDKIKE